MEKLMLRYLLKITYIVFVFGCTNFTENNEMNNNFSTSYNPYEYSGNLNRNPYYGNINTPNSQNYSGNYNYNNTWGTNNFSNNTIPYGNHKKTYFGESRITQNYPDLEDYNTQKYPSTLNTRNRSASNFEPRIQVPNSQREIPLFYENRNVSNFANLGWVGPLERAPVEFFYESIKKTFEEEVVFIENTLHDKQEKCINLLYSVIIISWEYYKEKEKLNNQEKNIHFTDDAYKDMLIYLGENFSNIHNIINNPDKKTCAGGCHTPLQECKDGLYICKENNAHGMMCKDCFSKKQKQNNSSKLLNGGFNCIIFPDLFLEINSKYAINDLINKSREIYTALEYANLEVGRLKTVASNTFTMRNNRKTKSTSEVKKSSDLKSNKVEKVEEPGSIEKAYSFIKENVAEKLNFQTSNSKENNLQNATYTIDDFLKNGILFSDGSAISSVLNKPLTYKFYPPYPDTEKTLANLKESDSKSMSSCHSRQSYKNTNTNLHEKYRLQELILFFQRIALINEIYNKMISHEPNISEIRKKEYFNDEKIISEFMNYTYDDICSLLKKIDTNNQDTLTLLKRTIINGSSNNSKVFASTHYQKNNSFLAETENVDLWGKDQLISNNIFSFSPAEILMILDVMKNFNLSNIPIKILKKNFPQNGNIKLYYDLLCNALSYPSSVSYNQHGTLQNHSVQSKGAEKKNYEIDFSNINIIESKVQKVNSITNNNNNDNPFSNVQKKGEELKGSLARKNQ